MAFAKINANARGDFDRAAGGSVDTKLSDRMDRSYRIFSEGDTTNQKVYKESTVLAKVNHNLSNLRTKQPHYYERARQEQMAEYHQIRLADIDRT